MVRSLAVIIWALTTLNPALGDGTKRAYAKVIRAEAKEHHIDPFTIAAMLWHESGLVASRIGDNGEAFGLGQIHARFLRGCDSKKPARLDDSPSCKRTKANLLNGVYNIKMTASTIAAKRKACRRITGRPALFHRWLAAYGGTRGICGQIKRKGKWRDLPIHWGVGEIINCRKSLLRKRKCRRLPPHKRKSASQSRSRKKKSTKRSTARSKTKRTKKRGRKGSPRRATKRSSASKRK